MSRYRALHPSGNRQAIVTGVAQLVARNQQPNVTLLSRHVTISSLETHCNQPQTLHATGATNSNRQEQPKNG